VTSPLPTRIVAPAIGLDVPVAEMGWTVVNIGGVQATGWLVPDHGAGFHRGSAYPGHAGNTVITAHSNTGGRAFRYLANLKIADTVTVYVGATPYSYVVTQMEILREEGVSLEQRRANGQWIAPTDDERLTLVTCWPNTGTSHRLIVVARPVS
jgi:sortase A